MHVYAINLLLVLTWQFCPNSKYLNRDRIYCYLVMVQLLLLALLRDITVGGDLTGYREWFDIISDTPVSQMSSLKNIPRYGGIEAGWNWLNKFLSVICPEFRIVMVFCSTVFIGTVTWFILKYSKIKWFSFFLFITLGYYTQSFSGLRQYLAISMILISLKYVFERKPWQFLIMIALACSFHQSAVCCLPIYFFPKIKRNGYYWLAAISFAAVLFVFSSELLFFFLSKTKYVSYYTRDFGQGSGDGMLVMFSCFLFLIVLYLKKNPRTDTKINMYLSMFLTSIFLNILALSLGIIGRVMLYFHIILMVLLPNVIFSIHNKDSKCLATIAICLVTSIYYFVFLLRADTSGIAPYQLMSF